MNNYILRVFRKFNIANTHIYMQIQKQILDIKFSPQVLLWVYKLALSLKKFSQPLFHKIVHKAETSEILLANEFWGSSIHMLLRDTSIFFSLKGRNFLLCLYDFWCWWWCRQLIARNCNSWNTTRHRSPSDVTKLCHHFLISVVHFSHRVLLTFFCPF